MLKDMDWPSVAFLCLQAMIAYAAAEVAYRYVRWYISTAKNEGLLLRSLILGIGVTHVAILAERVSWMYENFVHTKVLDAFHSALADEYARLLPIRSVMFIGIVIHLLPIWRILHNYKWWEIVVAVLVRSFAACFIYFAGLQLAGHLHCLIYIGCATP